MSIPEGYAQVWRTAFPPARHLMEELERIRLCAADAIEAVEQQIITPEAQQRGA